MIIIAALMVLTILISKIVMFTVVFAGSKTAGIVSSAGAAGFFMYIKKISKNS